MLIKNPKEIHISEFTYELPDERIAKYPLKERDKSKLLLYRKGNISKDCFENIDKYLPENSLMVFNNTKVIQARLHFRKETGALIEVFCLEPIEPNDYALNFQQTEHSAWLCMIGNLKKWKGDPLYKTIFVEGKEVKIEAVRGEVHGNSHRVDFRWDNPNVTFAEILDSLGELPIPPYLNRDTEESDKKTYQTVYSKIEGSVAAPTAGLHFTPNVLEKIKQRNIEEVELTLHVGAGTFKPVKSEEISGHDMHTEYISVRKETIERLIAYDGRAIAVGTTSVRTLESLYHMGVKIIRKGMNLTEKDLHVQQWQPYLEGEQGDTNPKEALQAILKYMNNNKMDVLNSSTQIIIAPGYKYHIVKAIVTNFHQPQSTLLLLVSAFIGEDWRRVYDYALKNEFRFLSYGDSSLLIPE